ncbi:MAG: hypothetical protein PVI42_14020 [Desulfobacterales bacterium]|jgi:hypothetical protein
MTQLNRQKKHISHRQTVLSLAILTILIIIGAGVITAQYSYNPAVLQQDALVPTVEKISDTSPPTADKFFLPLPQGLVPLTASEVFDAQNLSDKINGKAELYLSAGFVRLVSQRFKDERMSDLWIEVFIYDMANGHNAFSVFSAQRREDGVPLEMTLHSYRTSNALFLVHGSYYIEIIASEASERVVQPMELLADKFIRNTPTETVAINEMELFPQQDLVADSMALVSSDAFGYEGLDKVYTAEYDLDGAGLMAYFSRRQTNDDAEKISAAYRNFLVNFGGQVLEIQLPIKDAQLVEILDTYEIIFSYGTYMAGVREAENIEQAKKLVLRLFSRIKEVSDES